MSNSVIDTLWAKPPAESWQDDSAGSDTNQPGDIGVEMDIGSPTSLPGELRNIKSVVRGLSLDPAWVNYVGLTTSPDPDGNAPARVSTTQFTLIGDWTTIAVAGRKIRVSYTDGTPRATTMITASSYSAVQNLTTVTVADAVMGTLVGSLDYVEFSALGSVLYPAVPNTPENVLPFGMQQQGSLFVIPTQYGGTGNVSGSPGGAASGDLGGAYPSPTVTGIQGQHVLNTAPGDGDALIYEAGGARYVPTNVAELVTTLLPTLLPDILNGEVDTPNTDSGDGYIIFKDVNGVAALQIKFVTTQLRTGGSVTFGASGSGTTDLVTWGTPFPGFVFAVLAFTNNYNILVSWPDAASSLFTRVKTGVTLAWKNTAASSQQVYASIIAIGV